MHSVRFQLKQIFSSRNLVHALSGRKHFQGVPFINVVRLVRLALTFLYVIHSMLFLLLPVPPNNSVPAAIDGPRGRIAA